MKYYILAWHDDGEGNRAETLWEGNNLETAKQKLNEADFTEDTKLIELYEVGEEEDIYIDSRDILSASETI